MPSPDTGSPTSSVARSDDYRIDGLVQGRKWGGPSGTAADLSFSFADDDSVFTYGRYHLAPGYAAFDATQQDAFRSALVAWSDVTRINFYEIFETSTEVGELRVAFSDGIGGYGGITAYPAPNAKAADIWISPDPGYEKASAQVPGTFFHKLLMHEIGHTLGLIDLYSNQRGPYSLAEISSKYTIMAFANAGNVGINPQTPMLYDVFAIQQIYGEDTRTRAGDTLYTFDAGIPVFKTIWDAGGIDTLDFSNQALAVRVSLVPGTFSSVGPFSTAFKQRSATDNVAIAFGAVLENAVGTAHDDVIIGNDAANELRGGAGDDVLEGGAGDDDLDGGAGVDQARFRGPASAADIDHTDDGAVIVRLHGDGVDEVRDVEWFVFTDVTLSAAEMAERATMPQPVNRAPNANADTATGTVGVPQVLDLLGNDTDPDGDALRIIEVGNPSLGRLEVAAEGTVSYTPAAAGTERFDYVIGDGNGGIARATVTIDVAPPRVNAPPVAGADVLVTGTAGRDTGRGTAADETFDLLAGDDYAYGRDGNDHLLGGSGRDRLYGHDGADVLDGGVGDDSLRGGNGNDWLHGRAGDDRVYGDDGDDRITGGDGGDHLRGGNGDDWLAPGAGDDRLYGDKGHDLFDLVGAAGTDRIYDFKPGEDRLRLETAVFRDLDDNRDGALTAADSGVAASGLWLEINISDDHQLLLRRMNALGSEDLLLDG